MSGHTAGSWRATYSPNSAEWVVTAPNGQPLAWIDRVTPLDTKEEAANAHVMAAGSDLLAALDDVMRELKIWLDNSREDVTGIYDEAVPVGDEMIAHAQAAINKAEGRSQ